MHHISLAELGTCDVALSQEQALAAVGLAAISSDGDTSSDELTGLLDGLARLGVGDDDEARQAHVREAAGLARQHGLGPLTGSALQTLAAGRKDDALRLAFAVLMSDGDIPDDELRFIGELQHALGITDDRYDELLAEA